ncbi:hypothetical protein AB3662_35000 [Sorangium cellulosum]|uniref:hypothetical protein n=1 Tax=Sorangium cellulosum TaxID=56 RepID=UPI003D9A5F89
MDVFGNRHRFLAAMLVLFVPLLTGAEGKGCQTPGDGGPGAGGGGTAGGGPGGGGSAGGVPGACIETGCSGQICADEGVITTCEYREEYACYAELGVCERGASGECGWRPTPELEACLAEKRGEPPEPAPCVVTGCSGQICADEDVVTDCEYREEYACYAEFGICERDASGACGWQQTPKLEWCLEYEGGEPAEPGSCVVTGCSGEICADEDVVTTCEYRDEYSCYPAHSRCERDASGACGWRQTPELEACIEAASGDRTPVSGLCIRNSGDACTTDADCSTGGCGGELCHNPALSGGISTCDCTSPGLACGCVDGTCSFWN